MLGLTSRYRKHPVLKGQTVGAPKVALMFAAAWESKGEGHEEAGGEAEEILGIVPAFCTPKPRRERSKQLHGLQHDFVPVRLCRARSASLPLATPAPAARTRTRLRPSPAPRTLCSADRKTRLIQLSLLLAFTAMQTVNIHEAKTHLSRLVEQAAKGEPFIIAKAGRPLVKVVPLEAPEGAQVRRLGFLHGQIAVPDDFDRMAGAEIEQLFGEDALP